MQGPCGLYLGNLAKSLSEGLITEMCIQIDVKPIHVKIFRNKLTREPMGSALLLCATPADAVKITYTFNNSVIDGKAIRIMPYFDNFKENVNYKACIVIYHLPPYITQGELFALCNQFGIVQSCYLPIKPTGESTCTGFAMYTSVQEKEIAISRLDGAALIEGAPPLKVFPYFGREERIIHRYTKGTYNNLYVKGLPKEDFTESDLAKAFEKYGELHSLILNADPKDPTKNSGTAFVCFKENSSAMRAKEELHDKEVNGVKYHVDRHYKKTQMTELKEAQRKIKSEEWHAKHADSNLFVRPIVGKVSEEKIKTFFGKYGTIISIKAPKEKEKKFRFICYSNAEEAQKAIEMCDGKKIWGQILKVSLACNKAGISKRSIMDQELSQYSYPYFVPMVPPDPLCYEAEQITLPFQPIEQKEEENPYYIDKKYLRKASPEASKQYLEEKLNIIIAEKEPTLVSKIAPKILEMGIEEILPMFDETKITELIADFKSKLTL